MASAAEEKLKTLMAKNPDLVRRVSGIEVEEITMTKQGALGDEADTVLLFKSDEEPSVASLVSDAWPTRDSLVELSKEIDPELLTDGVPFDVAFKKEDGTFGVYIKKEDGPAQLSFSLSGDFSSEAYWVQKACEPVEPELCFGDVKAVLEKAVLTEDEKTDLVDITLRLAGEEAVLEKADEIDETKDNNDVATLLKGFGDIVAENTAALKSLISDRVAAELIAVNEQPTTLEKSEPVEAAPVLDVLAQAEQLLRKSRNDKAAQGRVAAGELAARKIEDLSQAVKGLSDRFSETNRKLLRACGQDA